MEQGKDIFREFFKVWPRFYYFIGMVFGPLYQGYMSPRQFLKKHFPHEGSGSILLNLGSGPKILRKDLINVDVTRYHEVHVVADLTALPFSDGTIDGFICETALEHVLDPHSAIAEMERVLKTGGIGYITVPFLYPFHSSPYDYTRWTEQGLRTMFSKFDIIEIGTRSGLFSVLNVWLCYLMPSIFSFGNDRLYWFFVNLSLIIFFPIKFLDIITNRLPFANRTASILFCVVRKKQ